MKILRKQKKYAIVSDAMIAKKVAKDVAAGSEYLKKHPLKIELLHPKKKSGWFSKV